MNHKKVVIVAVALVALLAIAGIGAAYAYTATTKNTDNTSGVEYLKMRSVTEGQESGLVNAFTANFSNDITIDTETAEVTVETSKVVQVTYTLHEPETVQSHNYIELGHVYLIIDNQKSTADGYTLNAVMSATGEGNIVNLTDFSYLVKYEVVTTEDEPTSASELVTPTITYVVYNAGASVAVDISGEDANYSFIKATLYAGLNGGSGIVDSVTKNWTDTPISANALKNATVTFTATVAEQP